MANWQFPDGATLAAVTSWDGGPRTDKIMLRMLDQYGYRGTFYLRPDDIGAQDHLDAETARKIAASGHELGLQGPGIGTPQALTPTEVAARLQDEKARLETLLGQPVQGLAYPVGFDPRGAGVLEAVAAAGFTSARTTETGSVLTASAIAKGSPLLLPVTARYSESLDDLRDKWDALEEIGEGVFHLWGDSREMGEDSDDWLDFECALGFFGGVTNVWYCTVGELIAHIQQQTGL